MRPLIALSFAPLAALIGVLVAAPLHAAPSAACSQNAFGTIRCEFRELAVGSPARPVRFQLPTGTPPVGGWPVAMIFHGTGGLASWTASPSGASGGPFGVYFQVQALKALLDAGYAVLAPPATAVTSAWQTNNSAACPAGGCTQNSGPTREQYVGSADDLFFLALFGKIASSRAATAETAAVDFGAALNSSRLYATGLSSGGYNTSRMAVNYPTRFRALAVHSASYANCRGPACTVPAALAAEHPPTLFLHGAGDTVVPVRTMFPYATALGGKGAQAVDYRRGNRLLGDTRCDATSQANCAVGHQWTAATPTEVLNWFNRHP